jgi:hypothetical protein
MEPATTTALGAFWAACASANFAAGIVGNLVAALGYDAGKSLLATALDRLRTLLEPAPE